MHRSISAELVPSSGVYAMALGSRLSRSSGIRPPIDGEPNGGLVGRSPFDAMPHVRRNMHVVPPTKRSRLGFPFEKNFGRTLEDQHPFRPVLVVEVARRAGVTCRDDPFDPRFGTESSSMNCSSRSFTGRLASILSVITLIEGLSCELFEGFPLPLPARCRESGKRKRAALRRSSTRQLILICRGSILPPVSELGGDSPRQL
jgi:hypothetical protein